MAYKSPEKKTHVPANAQTARNIPGLGSSALTGCHMKVNVNSLTLRVRMGFQAEILFQIYMRWRGKKHNEQVLVLSAHAFSDQPDPV